MVGPRDFLLNREDSAEQLFSLLIFPVGVVNPCQVVQILYQADVFISNYFLSQAERLFQERLCLRVSSLAPIKCCQITQAGGYTSVPNSESPFGLGDAL